MMERAAPEAREILTPAEARRRVEAAIEAIRSAAATDDPYERDLRLFLGGFDAVGISRLFSVDGVPMRYVTPLFVDGKVGAIVPTDPYTGEVLAWPGWKPGPKPAYLEPEEKLLEMARTGHPRAAEVVPTTQDRANRFSVGPADLERATLIDGWDRLPYKNQEERWAWVEEVRASGVMRTQWRYSPGVQYPAYKCLSYAGSTVADWWGWRLGHPPRGRYQSLVNGLQEYGIDPRELEVLYRHRAGRRPLTYPRLPPVGQGLDPVTRERIPCSLHGYSVLLTSPDESTHLDPLYRTEAPAYQYRPGMYHMDGPPKVLFLRGRQDEAAIVEALDRHGVVFAMTQTRILRMLRVGLHAIAIVGHYEREGRLTFIYHESYGNKASGYQWDNSGGPGLMSIPAKMLQGAVCFPHRLWLDVAPGQLALRHSEGGGVDAGGDLAARFDDSPVALDSSGGGLYRLPGLPAGRLRVRVRHRHFHAPSGGSVDFDIAWPGRGAPAAAWSIVRWATHAREMEDQKPVPVPAWIDRVQEECVTEAARWSARTGARDAQHRLAPYRTALLARLPSGLRKRLLRTFPVLG